MDRTTGNPRLWAASGYRYGSDPNAPLEREQFALVRIALPGGLFLFVLGIVGALVIAAMGGA